jgi:hypothetical protein
MIGFLQWAALVLNFCASIFLFGVLAFSGASTDEEMMVFSGLCFFVINSVAIGATKFGWMKYVMDRRSLEEKVRIAELERKLREVDAHD